MRSNMQNGCQTLRKDLDILVKYEGGYSQKLGRNSFLFMCFGCQGEKEKKKKKKNVKHGHVLKIG